MVRLKLEAELEGHDGPVWSVDWSPVSKTLATAGSDKIVRLWRKEGDCGKWVCFANLDGGNAKTIRQVTWSPCGRKLATASFDSVCAVWEYSDGEGWELGATLEGHENEVKSVAWSRDGDYLASCSRDKTVWVWEVTGDDYECASVLQVHTQDVKRVAWHPNTPVLASSSYDNTIKLYRENGDDWECYDTLSGHSSTVWAICFNKNGDKLVSCSDDRTLRVWTSKDSKKYTCASSLFGFHGRPIYDVCWGRHGYIASASGENTIRVFELNGSSLLLSHVEENAHKGDVNTIRWRGNLLASGGDDEVVRIWMLETT